MLFEFVIVQNPSEEEVKKGGKEKMIFGPDHLFAKTKEAALAPAVLKAKDKIPADVDPDLIQVIIRPF